MNLNKNPVESLDKGHAATRHRRLVRYLKLVMLAIVAGLLMTAYLIIGQFMAGHPAKSDFSTFYLTSVRMRYAAPIYWSPSEGKLLGRCDEVSNHLTPGQVTTQTGQELARLMPCQLPNLNPPFMIALTAPLAYLNYPAAWWLSWIVSFLCIALIGRRLVQEEMLPHLSNMRGMVFWVGYLAYYPTIGNLLLGQVTFFVMLPVVLGWLRLRRGSNGWGGVWLGLGASMKPFVGLFFVGLLVQKNGRAVIAMSLTCAVCVLLAGLLFGFDVYTSYLSVLGRIDWQAASWNASLAAFFSRIFGGAQNMSWVDEQGLGRASTWFVTLFLLYLYVHGLRCGRKRQAAYQADSLGALTIPAMLLISPLGWMYYFPMLLVTVLFLWRGRLSAEPHFRIATVVSLAMTAIPSHLDSAEDMKESLKWMSISAAYLGGLLAFFVLTISELTGTWPWLRQDKHSNSKA